MVGKYEIEIFQGYVQYPHLNVSVANFSLEILPAAPTYPPTFESGLETSL